MAKEKNQKQGNKAKRESITETTMAKSTKNRSDRESQ